MEFLQNLARLLTQNVVELFVFGLVLIILQRLLPLRAEQKNWDKSSAIDIAYSFLLTLSTPFFYTVPMAVTESLMDHYPVLANIGWDISDNLPFAAQLFLAVFVIDLLGYWRHRLMHYKWLWPIHVIHHCSKRLNWLSTERFHLFNHIITTSINIVFVQILLGQEVSLISTLLRRFYNLFIHANIKLDYGPLGVIFVSPRFHHWHHSVDPAVANKNYATFFALNDWCFGTFYLPKGKSYPQELGARDAIDENMAAQFIYPFKAWAKLIRGQSPGIAQQTDCPDP